jgi:gluconolactonase
MVSTAQLRKVAGGLDHPEGVATGPDGLLYAGGEAGQVYRIDPATETVEQIADTGGFVLGLAHDAAGRIYACDSGRAEVVRIDPATGAVETYCASAGGRPLAIPNWPAFAPDGSLVVSDSGTEDPAVREGRVFRVPPGGGDAAVLDLPPLHFPNGLAVGAGGAIHLLESYTPRLMTIRGSELDVVAEFPGTIPDGVALTADGGYVVACYYPYRLFHVDAAGNVEILLEDDTGIWLQMPTNVAFFGQELRQLAIAALGGWTITAVDVPFAGAPVLYPAL